MQKINPSTTSPAKETFNITQALVGLSLDESDKSTLSYLNLFSTRIPTTAAYFMFVLPKFDLSMAMYLRDSESLSSEVMVNSGLVNIMEESINNSMPNAKNFYTEFLVKEGNPLEEFLTSASELNVDLLVIGQNKLKNTHNILAKNLARNTTSKALVIPEGARQSLSNILVPIDFSKNSIRALEQAIRLHQQLELPTKITCLYVYSVPSLKHFKTDAGWIQDKSILESNIMDGFEAFLNSYAAEYKNRIEVALVEKTKPGIAKFISDHANENNFDLIVLGAKGHSNVHRLLMGSVAEELLDINKSIATLIIK